MKLSELFLLFFLLPLIVQINAYDQSATTTIGTTNATFSWEIKNFGLMEWKLSQNPKPIFGPLLETRNGHKVNCSVFPIYYDGRLVSLFDRMEHNNDQSFSYPKLVCDFSPEPTAVKYSFIGDDKKYSTVLIGGIKNNIEIIIDAFYSRTYINVDINDDYQDK
uniref:Uncharacterized protein n=1 Tax=Panagrolaimus sp. ES5 TaxID=591445 RepID=A0AC34G598_9BILA